MTEDDGRERENPSRVSPSSEGDRGFKFPFPHHNAASGIPPKAPAHGFWILVPAESAGDTTSQMARQGISVMT